MAIILRKNNVFARDYIFSIEIIFCLIFLTPIELHSLEAPSVEATGKRSGRLFRHFQRVVVIFPDRGGSVHKRAHTRRFDRTRKCELHKKSFDQNKLKRTYSVVDRSTRVDDFTHRDVTARAIREEKTRRLFFSSVRSNHVRSSMQQGGASVTSDAVADLRLTDNRLPLVWS